MLKGCGGAQVEVGPSTRLQLAFIFRYCNIPIIMQLSLIKLCYIFFLFHSLSSFFFLQDKETLVLRVVQKCKMGNSRCQQLTKSSSIFLQASHFLLTPKSSITSGLFRNSVIFADSVRTELNINLLYTKQTKTYVVHIVAEWGMLTLLTDIVHIDAVGVKK